jgi:1,4-dihydroxy-2-naphthoate octaprenyltransferase
VRTFASILGDRGSSNYYGFLLFGSLLLVAAYVAIPRLGVIPAPVLPWPCLIVAAVWPEALKLWGRAKRRHSPIEPLDFIILDGATARYNLLFGLLYTAGLWIERLLRGLRG